ncbi:hypothetical protein D039_4954A, partial [Vibrio parahaemolyticus EKP-028]
MPFNKSSSGEAEGKSRRLTKPP